MPDGEINVADEVRLQCLYAPIQHTEQAGSWDCRDKASVVLSRHTDSSQIRLERALTKELIAAGSVTADKVTSLPGGLVILVLSSADGSSEEAFAMRFDGPDLVTFKAVLLKHALIPEHKAPSTSRVSVCDAAGKPAHNGPASLFASKTEQGSADLYFRYYGALQHQQNMLQDYVRTATYHHAITDNEADFRGKLVMDVGAGTGILSLFAAQAGAAKVYAVEASAMAGYAQALAKANPGLGARLQVVEGKVEELQGLPQVDVLVSEPMGTLLVNERMLETYLYARDHFLRPGGRMFPNLGRVHVAAFSDEVLHAEIVAKANFWLETNYFGIDLSSLHSAASAGYFQQVVVDAIPPQCLVSTCATREFDFQTIREEELHDFTIPLDLPVGMGTGTGRDLANRLTGCACYVHGVACWFDVAFVGSTLERWLSTAPGYPTTHWFQLRCVLMQPLLLKAGQAVQGSLRLAAHNQQSYDLYLDLTAPPLTPGADPQQASGKLDLKEPYYRQLTQWPSDPQAWTAPQAAVEAGAAGTTIDESVFADAQPEDAGGLLVAPEPASSAVQNADTGYLF